MNSGGFTLIELLVVVSVVVLLMALLLPALSRARKQARAVVCQANARQWGVMFTLYASEHDGRLIYPPYPSHIERFLYEDDRREIPFLCPAATRCEAPRQVVEAGGDYPRPIAGEGGKLMAWWIMRPTSEPHEPLSGQWLAFWGSYGTNGYIGDPMVESRFDAARAESAFRAYVRKRWTRTTLRKPGCVPFLFDCAFPFVDPRETDQPPSCEEDFMYYTPGEYWEVWHDTLKGVCIDRHGNGSMNMAFADGASRRVGLKELWTLKWHTQYNQSGPWTKAGGVRPTDWPDWMRKFKEY